MDSRRLLVIAFIAVVLRLIGCTTTDPLTQYINHHGFEQIFPPTSKATVGDIYESPQLTGQPIELVENILSESERNELMASLARDITLMNTSRDSMYKIQGDLFFVGYFEAELRNEGITNFRVSAGDATEYLMSRGYFDRILLPRLQDKQEVLEGAYIYSLLEVRTLEYEFYNEKGTKVDIQPGDRIAEAFQAKAGIEWTVNERRNIEISSPRFVGFKSQMLSADRRDESRPPSRSRNASSEVQLLIAQIRDIRSDFDTAAVINREVPRFGFRIPASDFIQILHAANLSSDFYRTSVIVRCAPFLQYPITAEEMRAIMTDFSSDFYSRGASRALNDAARR